MVHDRSQDTVAAVNGQAARQAIAGLMPPQLGEALIREVWPTVLNVSSGVAGLSGKLMRSAVFAPLGWMLNSLLFIRKFAPFLCQRYTVTNRRLMVQRGWKPAPTHEVALKDIDDVQLIGDSYDAFYRFAKAFSTPSSLGADPASIRVHSSPPNDGRAHREVRR
jgi:hypothetical protein